ncbi:MAG: hypothetical protein RL021_2 [Bacteroidota bacterium]|jgi:hypothetical protein
MSENRLREKEEIQDSPPVQETTEASSAKRRKKSGLPRNFIRFINVFDWFDRDQVARNMPFILFLSLLVMGYIANSYYAERLIRDIDKTKTELKEKSAEFITIRSKLMYSSKQSEVAKSVEPYQLKESMEPPKKLVITSDKPTSR